MKVPSPLVSPRVWNIPVRKVLFLLAVMKVVNYHLFGRFGMEQAQNGCVSHHYSRIFTVIPVPRVSQPRLFPYVIGRKAQER